jgi:hypothetical protein
MTLFQDGGIYVGKPQEQLLFVVVWFTHSVCAHVCVCFSFIRLFVLSLHAIKGYMGISDSSQMVWLYQCVFGLLI